MIRYIIIINIITFFVYGIDKYLAYKIFRHKTKKKSFKTSIILIIIIQVVTVYFLTLNKNVLDEIIKIVGIW